MNNLDLTTSEVKTGDLTPSMDIFSAGLALHYEYYDYLKYCYLAVNHTDNIFWSISFKMGLTMLNIVVLAVSFWHTIDDRFVTGLRNWLLLWVRLTGW